jgi:hypothetical protein
MKKSRKKVFFRIYTGIKSEFLRPKTLFMQLKDLRINSLEKKLFLLFIRGTIYGVSRESFYALGLRVISRYCYHNNA